MHLDNSANQKKPETEFVPHFCFFFELHEPLSGTVEMKNVFRCLEYS